MNETVKIKCPCCGKCLVGEYEICSVCNWENDPNQLLHEDLRGANQMSLKEAQNAYNSGKSVK